MSQPQICNVCGYDDGMYINFGDHPIHIRMYHGNFTCPDCGTSRSTTYEEVKQDLKDLYEERGWGNVEDKYWWKNNRYEQD